MINDLTANLTSTLTPNLASSLTAHDHDAVSHTGTAGAPPTDDLRISAIRPLVVPALVQERVTVRDETLALVGRTRAAIADILHGRDDRLLVVVGPCSIHDHEQALEYGQRLKAVADTLGDELVIVMRAYFEKPRTTVGWKGYINDPHLDGTFAINEGLERARRLLVELDSLGMPTGTEYLDLLSPQYISDLVSWGAIGARTTESQSHRQLASGLSCPVGFKNGTDGSVKVAADAILAARSSHAFMGMTKLGVAAIFETTGNEDCHVILRGGTRPNHDAASVAECCASLRAAGLREQVMIDVSHGNSEKQFRRQLTIAGELAERVAAGDQHIIGVMIESHLEEGKQALQPGAPLRRGVSITDACIGFADTAPVLEGLARAVSARRSRRVRST
ncbi:MAG: 3-deoxy-7-phosphoheptulonate synthase [Gemmatimonadaceae bacterium]|nr:3-deoxy-7-phosphoheptulonate synthase [Gemmatimonadaceae bacterium]